MERDRREQKEVDAAAEPGLQGYSLIRPTESHNVMTGHYTLLIALMSVNRGEEKGGGQRRRGNDKGKVDESESKTGL